MGRIQRIALAEDDIKALDLGYPRSGKPLIRNAGTTDILVGYTRTDVNDATASGQFFTLDPGIVYTFDMSQTSGFLAQNQLLYFNSNTGDGTIEIWQGYEN